MTIYNQQRQSSSPWQCHMTLP